MESVKKVLLDVKHEESTKVLTSEKGHSAGLTHGQPQRVSCRQTVRAFFKLFYPYFVDKKTRCKACALLLTIGIFLYLEVTTTVRMASAMKDVHNAVVHKDEKQFYDDLWNVVKIVLYLLPVLLFHMGAAAILKLSWRKYLTEHAFGMYGWRSRWQSAQVSVGVSFIGVVAALPVNDDQCFYRLKMQYGGIDNPDQRIAQDIGQFTNTSFTLVTHLARDVLTVVMNSFALVQISQELFWVLITFGSCYAVLTMVCFASPLMRVQRRLLAVEADMRYVLMRLREHAESIAFFRGAEFEREGCQVVLDRVITSSYKKVIIETIFHALTGLIHFVMHFLPMLVVVPMYFKGATSFGTIQQSQALFNHLMKGMLDFGKEMSDIASLGAQSIRVQELWDALEEIRVDGKAASRSSKGGDGDDSTSAGDDSSDEEIGGLVSDDEEDGTIHVVDLDDADTANSSVRLQLHNVTLFQPFGSAPLIRGLSLELRRGESLLIEGPSGAGKSSLLRAIGGLWARGQGTVARVELQRCFFVPQSPYLCLGSLRDNVKYPAESLTHEISDADILDVLRCLNIEHLATRHGLDEPLDFESILSGGEKQRLSFSRLLLRRGLEFVLLDEATSALDERNEKVVYDLVKKQVPCYVSVGHRPQLAASHTHKLVLEKLGPEDGCIGKLTVLRQLT